MSKNLFQKLIADSNSHSHEEKEEAAASESFHHSAEAAYKSFDGQVIINFGSDIMDVVACHALMARWNKHHPDKKCEIVNGIALLSGHDDASQINCSKLFGPKDFARIYVFVHAFPRLDVESFYIDENSPLLSVERLAEILIDFIGNQPAVINLITCGAGRGVNDSPSEASEKSKASRLHAALYQRGMNIDVVARTQIVGIVYPHNELVRLLPKRSVGSKITRGIHIPYSEASGTTGYRKQPGSKIVFTEVSGVQVKEDACLRSWKRKVFRLLTERMNGTKVEEKETLLCGWLKNFENYSPQEIFDFLQSNHNSSIINKNSMEIRFFMSTRTSETINKLLKDGKKLLDSVDTMQTPVEVKSLKSQVHAHK
jgi:hypothetical protein